MNAVMWYPQSALPAGPRVAEEKLPWFLRNDYAGKRSLSSMDEREVVCAEVLLSLRSLIPSTPSVPSPVLSLSKLKNGDIPLTKQELKAKKKIKRNTNPCTEHRRKHQRCPTGCIGRKRDMQNAGKSGNSSSSPSSSPSSSAPSSPISLISFQSPSHNVEGSL